MNTALLLPGLEQTQDFNAYFSTELWVKDSAGSNFYLCTSLSWQSRVLENSLSHANPAQKQGSLRQYFCIIRSRPWCACFIQCFPLYNTAKPSLALDYQDVGSSMSPMHSLHDHIPDTLQGWWGIVFPAVQHHSQRPNPKS